MFSVFYFFFFFCVCIIILPTVIYRSFFCYYHSIDSLVLRVNYLYHFLCLHLLTSTIFLILHSDFSFCFIDLCILSSKMSILMFMASQNFPNFRDLYLYSGSSTIRPAILQISAFLRTISALSDWE